MDAMPEVEVEESLFSLHYTYNVSVCVFALLSYQISVTSDMHPID